MPGLGGAMEYYCVVLPVRWIPINTAAACLVALIPPHGWTVCASWLTMVGAPPLPRHL